MNYKEINKADYGIVFNVIMVVFFDIKTELIKPLNEIIEYIIYSKYKNEIDILFTPPIFRF